MIFHNIKKKKNKKKNKKNKKIVRVPSLDLPVHTPKKRCDLTGVSNKHFILS